jgi:hypothetical protein
MVYPHIQYRGPAYTDRLPRPSLPAEARELDSRINDGIHVRLLWHLSDGHMSVAVDDTKTSETFDVRVGAGDRALDVFHHPYAYASRRAQRPAEPWKTSSDTALAA